MSLIQTIGVWLLILPFMVGNGVFRELVLMPNIGAGAAEVLSALIGIAVILLITRFFVRRTRDRSTSSLARTAVTWLLLTVAFEFLFGHYVDGRTWGELVENYAIWRGNLWPFVLASLVASPFIWGKWGGSWSRHARL